MRCSLALKSFLKLDFNVPILLVKASVSCYTILDLFFCGRPVCRQVYSKLPTKRQQSFHVKDSKLPIMLYIDPPSTHFLWCPLAIKEIDTVEAHRLPSTNAAHAPIPQDWKRNLPNNVQDQLAIILKPTTISAPSFSTYLVVLLRTSFAFSWGFDGKLELL